MTQAGHNRVLTVKKARHFSAISDLAILETEESVENHLTLSESMPKVSETLFIAGYPMGRFKIIYSLNSSFQKDGNFLVFTQSDSATSGASGAPLLNSQGEVLGLYSGSIGNIGQAFLLNGKRSSLPSAERSPGFKVELENLKKEARKGRPIAQDLLTNFYLGGWNNDSERNLELALQWKEEALKPNFSLEHNFMKNDLAFILTNPAYIEEPLPEDLKSAFQWTKELADRKDTASQGLLAKMYYEGKGTRKNFKKAFQYAMLSAKKDFAMALALLAEMHYYGRGTEKNRDKAFKLALEAAKRNEFSAKKLLWEMYDKHKFVRESKEFKRQNQISIARDCRWIFGT